MSHLYVGTSGWAYTSWKPEFYPPKLAQAKFLTHYATQLNAVEVNFTFRQLLKETTAQTWAEQTPAGFRFIVKAHQVLTHSKRLKDTEEFLTRFLETLEPIARAGKLGPVLFQLPPNFKCDLGVLNSFLATVPRAIACACEFRHDSWFVDATYEALARHNAALCVAEDENRVTPDVVTASFCYYRYRLPSYTPEQRVAMIQRLREHAAAGRDAYAFFKHEATPRGALYAIELLGELSADATRELGG